jgi:tetratricopeptide (TPR) repeat protein
LAWARKLGLRIESAQTLFEMGSRLQDGGMIEQAMQEFSEAGATVGLAFAFRARARNDAQSSAKTASALKHDEEAIAALTDVKAEYRLAAACLKCSRLHKQLGQLEQARTKLTAALDIFNTVGASAEENTVRQELARLSSPARSAQ